MFPYMHVLVATDSIYTYQFFKVLILYFMVIIYSNYKYNKPERLLKNCILSTLSGKKMTISCPRNENSLIKYSQYNFINQAKNVCLKNSSTASL